MDRDWMTERLWDFEDKCRTMDGYGTGWGPKHSDTAAEIHRAQPTVHKILNALESGLGDRLVPPEVVGGSSTNLGIANQGIGILEDFEEVRTRLAPDSPSVSADRFHVHAWAPAAALWDTGNFRVAVSQSATAISEHLAARVASDLRERELVQQVFSPSAPREGTPRLHFPGEQNATWRSRQDGLHLVAQGAFAGIRNVAVHTSDEWPEWIALERLAVLSTVARWADETVVVKA